MDFGLIVYRSTKAFLRKCSMSSLLHVITDEEKTLHPYKDQNLTLS